MMPGQWFAYAVLALNCFAGCNFFLGGIGKESPDPAVAGVSATYVLWLVSGVCCLVSLALRCGKIGVGGARNAAYAVAAGIFMGAAMLILALGIAADPASAGPITAMLPLAALFVGFLAYVLLGERVTLIQMAGMVIAVTGPICMALANMSTNALHGLLLGLGAALGIALNNFCLKLAGSRGADDISVLILMFLTHLLAGVVTVSWQLVDGTFLAGLDTVKLQLFAVGSGFLFYLACLFLVLALKGNAGPASATSNASSIGVLILDAIVYSPPMQPLKIVGMALTICGVTLLALAPQRKTEATQVSPPDEKVSVPEIEPNKPDVGKCTNDQDADLEKNAVNRV